MLLGDSFRSLDSYGSSGVVVGVYDGHGGCGPEGCAMTPVMPFMGTVMILDGVQPQREWRGARGDGGWMMACGRCTEDHLAAGQTLLRLERSVSRGLGSGELGPGSVAEALGGSDQHDAGQGAGAGLVLCGGHQQRGGIGVSTSTLTRCDGCPSRLSMNWKESCLLCRCKTHK